MRSTYMVVDKTEKHVQNYYEYLTDAKDFVERTNPSHIIVKLWGCEFGEGFHIYKLAFRRKPDDTLGFVYIERDGIRTACAKAFLAKGIKK